MEDVIVILHLDGISRTYRCDSQFDAEVLFDALARATGGRVELWNGMVLRSTYSPDF